MRMVVGFRWLRLGSPFRLGGNSFIGEEAHMEAQSSKQETRVSRILRQASIRASTTTNGNPFFQTLGRNRMTIRASFDKSVLSEPFTLRQAQGER
jgi:hypothetical protein